ncbi:MAG: ATP-binding protein, partial [Spirochaetota bacterium]
MLKNAIEKHPVVILTGARQVGKSTLLRHEKPFTQWRYITFDDYDALRQAKEKPEALWAGTESVVLDEVQKVPEIFSSIKKTVDNRLKNIRFMLSGSANILLMQQVSESLAGRAVYFILDPLSLGEVYKRVKPDFLQNTLNSSFPAEVELPDNVPDIFPILFRGFLPPLLRLASTDDSVRWWDGYVSTYLERDLRQISQIANLVDFRRVMEMAALRSGQLFNQSEVARDIGVSQPTVNRYLNILETTYMFQRVPAFSVNRSSRIIKTPKSFCNDTGLAV